MKLMRAISVSVLAAVILMGATVGQVETASGLFSSPVPPPSQYRIIDLGSLGGGYSSAFHINARGQVVGLSSTAPGEYDYSMHAFLWENGVMTDLGIDEPNLQVRDLNERGQVVGVYEYEDLPGEPTYAFLWQDGQVTDLGTLGGIHREASAINERGQIVGTSDTGDGLWHAFLWEKGAMTDLGTLGGSHSSASAINKRGQIVGTSLTASGGQRATLWEGGAVIDLVGEPSGASDINERGQVVGGMGRHGFFWEKGVVSSLQPPGATWFSGPNDINERGQVALSEMTSTGEYRAYLWENGITTNLGTLGGASSNARAINNRGQIVGRSQTASGEFHGFLWENGVMTDLETLGGTYCNASNINELGQILGGCSTDSGEWHAVLWTR
jgi:probable HAF family extracellular repeat protein